MAQASTNMAQDTGANMVKYFIDRLLKNPRTSVLLLATVVINVLALGSSFYSIHLLNRYVTIGLTPTLVTLTLGVVIAIVFELVLRKERQNVLVSISRENDTSVSKRVFRSFSLGHYEKLSALPLPLKKEALGAPAVHQQLLSVVNMGSVLDLPFAILFLGAATLLYWPMGIIGVAMAAIVLYLGYRNEQSQRAAAAEHAKANAKFQQLGQFLLGSGETVRGLPVIGPLLKRWSRVARESLGSRRDGMVIQSSLQTTIQTLTQVLTVIVYCVGAIAVVRGDLTTGALIGANILVARGFSTCSRVAYLSEVLLRAQRAEDALLAVEKIEQANATTGMQPNRHDGHLELFDLAFAYPQQPVPLLEGLNVDLPPGKVLVIVGPNGAGKSTLIKLMLGLLTPTRGMLRSDQIELRQLSQEWWRNHIGYAPQEPVFFDGTLRENLVLDRDVSDDELLEWIREVNLETFLATDPAGLDRQIVGQETGMAVGIRRRFAIVRAMLAKPQVVFLDDPTEGLDQSGQAAVARLLNRMSKEKRTMVIVSNDAFIGRAADWVIDMSVKPTPKVTAINRQASAAVITNAKDKESGSNHSTDGVST